jgi:endonuclease/exonuclease/phosphatase (EEP) superfamily protein YafD
VTRLFFFAFLGALTLLGCVSIPAGGQLIAYSDAGLVRMDDAVCASGWWKLPAGAERGAALDPAGFRVMIWNVYKAQEENWSDEFAQLSEDQDLVLLQEAHLTRRFRTELERSRYWWSMVRAFDFKGVETGVLTAGKGPASAACLHRAVEPLIRTPKSALLARFILDGSREELWVANLHGVNFTLGVGSFREQLETLAEVLERHSGPLILAGDFNNWSGRRSAILRTINGRLNLMPLQLTEDKRSRHWGRHVDHVFYRGLEVVAADSREVSSSDHNPVRVKFRVPGY